MHIEIEKYDIYEDGGLVIKFENDYHTFIPPEEMREIVDYITENIVFKDKG